MRAEFPPEKTPDPDSVQKALEAMEGPRKGVKKPRMTLEFEQDLEQGYLRHRADSVLLLQRIAIALGMVFYMVYMGHDAWFGERRYADPLIWGTLMAFAAPGNIALFIATFLKDPWRYSLPIARMGALLHTVGMILCSYLGSQRGMEEPFQFLIVQLMYDFFLLGLVWKQANLLALLTVIAAPVMSIMFKQSAAATFDFAFFVTVTAILGSIGCYMQERSQRLAWLRAQLLQQLSDRDALTGTYNHRAFYARSERLIRQARRDGAAVAVFGIDVDHFKRFNDQFGHLAGDECLRRVAAVVTEHARRPLDLAARLGGEEFAIFLYDVSRSNAMARAEELRDAISRLVLPVDAAVTVSIGVATATPLDPISIEGMVGQADVALYRAKREHRNCVREWAETRAAPLYLAASSSTVPGSASAQPSAN